MLKLLMKSQMRRFEPAFRLHLKHAIYQPLITKITDSKPTLSSLFTGILTFCGSYRLKIHRLEPYRFLIN